jgi:putative redox protein
MSTQEYSVNLRRHPDGEQTTATVRDFSLELGSKAGDLSVGFNPVETLLSAAGACITSSLGLVARNSNVTIEDMRVSARATRESDPPHVSAAELEVSISSPADDDKLERIFRIAGRSSTVVSTLREAMDVKLRWKRVESAH